MSDATCLNFRGSTASVAWGGGSEYGWW